MIRTSSNLAPLLEGFFVEWLMTQKQVSKETVSAYRDTFRLLLRYAHKVIKKMPSKLELNDLDAPFICAFLNYLEQVRKNSPRTRNHRLAAIRSFYSYVSFQQPQHSGLIQRVLAIPCKRWQKRLIDFLSVAEVDAILGVIDTSCWMGRRDYALFTLALHTGFRVSELINLHCDDISLDKGPYVRCHGKGRKERSVPLGMSVLKTIQGWLRERNGKSYEVLFPNRQGEQLSRDGIQYLLRKYVAIAAQNCPSLKKKRVTPHVLRHTTAVHLLHSGVDLSVIALWLGHESPETTQVYIDSDLEQKKKILEKTMALNTTAIAFRPDDDLMAFLQGL